MVEALGAHALDLVQQRPGIDHHAVADHRQLALHHARRQQRELVDAVADHEGVAGVVAALEAHHHVGAVGQPVDHLALALVAPLGADHRHIGQVASPPAPLRGKASPNCAWAAFPRPFSARRRNASSGKLRTDPYPGARPLRAPGLPPAPPRPSRSAWRCRGPCTALVEHHAVGVQGAAGAVVAALGRGAQEGHGAGRLLQDVGEVLGAHHRMGHGHPAVLAEQGLGRALGQVGDPPVVDGDREAAVDVHLAPWRRGPAAMCSATRADALVGDGAGVLAEGAQGARAAGRPRG